MKFSHMQSNVLKKQDECVQTCSCTLSHWGL